MIKFTIPIMIDIQNDLEVGNFPILKVKGFTHFPKT